MGAIPAANTWDTPNVFFIRSSGVDFLGVNLRSKNRVATYAAFVISPIKEIWDRIRRQPEKSGGSRPSWSEWSCSLIAIALLVAAAWILYSPYYLNFHPQGAKGIRIVDAIQRTLWDDFLTIYGFFLLLHGYLDCLISCSKV